MGRLRERRRCNIKQINFKILHTRARRKSCKNSQRQKAVICLVYERGNNMDGRRALSPPSGGVGVEENKDSKGREAYIILGRKKSG